MDEGKVGRPALSDVPSQSVRPVAQDLLDELEQQHFATAGITDLAQHQAVAAADRLARRDADRAFVEELALEDFAGPKWMMFQAELASYGYPVMMSWIRRGLIFTHCAKLGRSVSPGARELHHLAEDFEDRNDLAVITVAEALLLFRQHALLDGAWSADRGASLKTFFAGTCQLVFPNVYREWHRTFEKTSLTDEYGLVPAHDAIGHETGQDPGDLLIAKRAVGDALRAIQSDVDSDTVRAAEYIVYDDLSKSDAAQAAGLTPRALRARFEHLRQRRDRQQERGHR
jgi:hypothetical protein